MSHELESPNRRSEWTWSSMALENVDRRSRSRQSFFVESKYGNNPDCNVKLEWLTNYLKDWKLKSVTNSIGKKTLATTVQ